MAVVVQRTEKTLKNRKQKAKRKETRNENYRRYTHRERNRYI